MALRRWARRLLFALTILGVIVLAAAAGLPRIVDANRYRPLVSAWAQEATGRSVRIGTIAFGLLPLPSLSVRPLAIAESARYPGRDMLTAESLSIRLGIIGLLRGRLTFRSIVLNRPTLTLVRDAQGRWNFDDLLARASAASSSVAASSQPGGAASAPGGIAASGIASGAPGISIEEARARNGRILVYDDAVVPGRRSEVSLGPFDAAVTGWGAGRETRLELAAGLGRSVLRSRARLLADGGERIEGEFASDSLLAADLAKLLPWLGVARPSGLEIGGTIALLGTEIGRASCRERV